MWLYVNIKRRKKTKTKYDAVRTVPKSKTIAKRGKTDTTVVYGDGQVIFSGDRVGDRTIAHNRKSRDRN